MSREFVLEFPHLPAVLVEVRDYTEHQQKCWTQGCFYEAQGFGLITWMRANVPQGCVAVDVGASIGNHTLFLAKCLGCQVIAVEPVPESIDHLHHNIRLNSMQSMVEVHECAVADRDGECRMQHIAEDNAGMWEMRPGTGTRVTTLDKIVGPRRVHYIKIDVEHTEVAVLDGAERILRTYHPLLSIECTDPPEVLDDRLIPLGYTRDDIVLNHTPTYVYRWTSQS